MRRKKALTWAPLLPSDASRTFWGGYPLWPKDEPWPIDEGWPGRPPKPSMFLAQFDVAELSWKPPELPDSGILYLFSGPEDVDPDFGRANKDFSVYFASADRELERRKPPQSKGGLDAHLFAGNLKSGHWRKRTIWYSRDYFAAFSLRMVEFEDPWSPNQNENIRSEEARAARKKALEDALSKLGSKWRKSHVDQEWRVSCANVIDPTGLRFNLPMALPKQIPDDARHADWPLCSGNILYHCVQIATDRHEEDEVPLPENSVAGRIQEEAIEWAIWAKNQNDRLLMDEERMRYRKWAADSFIEVVEKWKETTPLSLPGDAADEVKERSSSNGAAKSPFERLVVSLFRKRAARPAEKPRRQKLVPGSDREAEYRGLCHVLSNLFQCNPYWSDFGLICLGANQLEKMPSWAKQKYLEQCPRGQLFGFGHDEQGEVHRNQDHVLLADIYNGGDVRVGDAFKIFLVGKLRINDWQTVVIEHPV